MKMEMEEEHSETVLSRNILYKRYESNRLH